MLVSWTEFRYPVEHLNDEDHNEFSSSKLRDKISSLNCSFTI